MRFDTLWPVHWLTHEFAIAQSLHPEEEEAEHAMPLEPEVPMPPSPSLCPPADTCIHHGATSGEVVDAAAFSST